MKTRILLLIFLSGFAINLLAQPLNWKESLFDPAKTSVISKESTQKSEGNYSLKYTFTDPGTPYYLCDTFNVTAGATYNFSIDYLDNDATGLISARLWFHASPKAAYLERKTTGNTVDSPTWQSLSLTGTVPATATIAVIAIRMNPTSATGFTSATFLADNVKYTEGTSTTNLIKNGGFENWFVPSGSTVLNWTESLYDPAKTSTITNEKTIVKEGFNSVKYTFTDPGTPYFLCDTFNVTAGLPYNFAIDYYDNDPNGIITARLWFHASPKTAYLERKTTTNSTDGPNWQTSALTGTIPATATIAVVAIRMNPTTATGFTSATFYADNAIFTQGTSTTNLIKNGGFEDWKSPDPTDFSTFKFASLNPVVNGVINMLTKTVKLEVPFSTNVTALIPTFTVPEGVSVKIGAVNQVSGTTANDYTNPVKYTLTKGTTSQEWTVTISKPAPTTGKDIITFNFNGLTPSVIGVVNATAKTIALQVPSGTNLTSLVPTITLSTNATVAPASGASQNFTAPVTYAVTAQDGTKQNWTVTVTQGPAGQTVLFFEDFEKSTKIPSGWVLINNDKYIQAAGEERWQDSAWVVATSSRTELVGTKLAMASSITTNMPMTGRADDWMILPEIQLGANSTLSWQAMSATSSGNYPDDYKVYIAPVTSGVKPTVAYFEENSNLLLSVAPENWSATVGRPGAGLATRSVNLKSKITPDAPNGWFNKKVWIAFVMVTDLYTNPTTGIPNTSPGGSALAIDNIKVVNDTGTGIEEISKDLKIKVYPNPANNELFIDMESWKNNTADIRILDMTGREVLLLNKSITSGFNRLSLDISVLKQGVYFVSTLVDEVNSISKLIVQD